MLKDVVKKTRRCEIVIRSGEGHEEETTDCMDYTDGSDAGMGGSREGTDGRESGWGAG